MAAADDRPAKLRLADLPNRANWLGAIAMGCVVAPILIWLSETGHGTLSTVLQYGAIALTPFVVLLIVNVRRGRRVESVTVPEPAEAGGDSANIAAG